VLKLVSDLKVAAPDVRGMGIQALKLDSDPKSHGATTTLKGTLPAPPLKTFDASKAPQWVQEMVKAKSPAKRRDEEGGRGKMKGIEATSSGEVPEVAGRQSEECGGEGMPADVAEMYASYYAADDGEAVGEVSVPSPGGKVGEMLRRAGSVSPMKKSSTRLLEGGGVGSSAKVQEVAQSVEDAFSFALSCPGGDGGELEKAGRVLEDGIVGALGRGDAEGALVLVDVAFVLMLRVWAPCQTSGDGVDERPMKFLRAGGREGRVGGHLAKVQIFEGRLDRTHEAWSVVVESALRRVLARSEAAPTSSPLVRSDGSC
jgi:hypothetical protein